MLVAHDTPIDSKASTTGKVGSVAELWHYPVSSIGGQKVDRLAVLDNGVPDDRRFCLFDPATGRPAAPEKEPRWRAALFLRARTASGAPGIGFPDGTSIAVTDPEMVARLSKHFGFSVHVGATDRLMSGKTGLPFVENRYKPSPVHLLTTASLRQLGETGAFGEIDRQRFRPTVLIETAAVSGFQENDWVGRVVRIGEVLLRATESTKRCGMTLIPQPGIAEDPEILRNIVRHNKRNLGIYCDVAKVGKINAGDAVYVVG